MENVRVSDADNGNIETITTKTTIIENSPRFIIQPPEFSYNYCLITHCFI
jgi:hypothetical protein